MDYLVSYENNLYPGTAALIITGMGNFEGEIIERFEIEPASLEDARIIDLQGHYAWTGEEIRPHFTLRWNDQALVEGIDYFVEYEDNINPGEARITIRGTGNFEGGVDAYFFIHKEDDPEEPVFIGNAVISGLHDQYEWTGSPVCPLFSIEYEGEELVENVDYQVDYSNNTDPGTATIKIDGIGRFDGTLYFWFDIVKPSQNPQPVSIKNAALEGIAENYTYTGSPVKPEPVVRLNGQILVRDRDYTVAYTNNINPGKATLTITGIGAYTDTLTKNFTITDPREQQTEPAETISLGSVKITGVDAVYIWNGTEIRPKPILEYKGERLKEGVDYTLTYTNTNKIGPAKILIEGTGKRFTGSVTLSYTIQKKSDPAAPSTKPDQSGSGQTQQPSAQVERVSMHRLYNPNSGEHFYTADTHEKNELVKLGWKFEGQGWVAPKSSSIPVYRLYNKNAGDHHYTMNKDEKDMLVSVGWKYEGIGWYSDEKKSVPLYRQYNPNAKAGSHNYTTSKEENDFLISVGWKGEGIAWYGLK